MAMDVCISTPRARPGTTSCKPYKYLFRSGIEPQKVLLTLFTNSMLYLVFITLTWLRVVRKNDYKKTTTVKALYVFMISGSDDVLRA